MIVDVLNLIKTEMQKLDMNYQYGRYDRPVSYPYFVGECSAGEFVSENNYQEGTVFINGFSRNTRLELLEKSETIKNHFADFRAITESGNGVSITVAAFSVIPQEDAELKRVQITLNVKKWSVDNE